MKVVALIPNVTDNSLWKNLVTGAYSNHDTLPGGLRGNITFFGTAARIKDILSVVSKIIRSP